jgi:hypothetical protein
LVLTSNRNQTLQAHAVAINPHLNMLEVHSAGPANARVRANGSRHPMLSSSQRRRCPEDSQYFVPFARLVLPSSSTTRAIGIFGFPLFEEMDRSWAESDPLGAPLDRSCVLCHVAFNPKPRY